MGLGELPEPKCAMKGIRRHSNLYGFNEAYVAMLGVSV